MLKVVGIFQPVHLASGIPEEQPESGRFKAALMQEYFHKRYGKSQRCSEQLFSKLKSI